ncbi:hypothetical protein Pcinc_007717 [Petrolisthes cinctipes]|uniref:Uncharacterized protein n=1 Tax=Petrolisthes cinctipes TaxID=88211 RepID=A0AAE1KWL5_PETCI|nr:hypothetical protein Pcinc_007717 [Petrolisthes cinctipes]
MSFSSQPWKTRNARTARRPNPALTIRSAVSRAPEAKKEKDEHFMTYDPLHCMICKAFIAESENGVAAAQAELRKHVIAIRGYRQRSHCPSADLMNFFSSKEEANRLFNLAHYIPTSPHAHNGSSPRKRPRSHSPISEEDSATPAPAKKQRRDAALNYISSLLLQFAQCVDELKSYMAVMKSSNSQLQQDRASLKGKRNLPFSSSSSSEDENDNPPPAAQPDRSLPPLPQWSPSPPHYSLATYSLSFRFRTTLSFSFSLHHLQSPTNQSATCPSAQLTTKPRRLNLWLLTTS